MKIKNHQLEGITITDSPNRGGTLNPDSIIIHYTAGPSANSAIKTLIDPNTKASAHLVVDFDGSITQLVPFNIIAWHAGKSRHNNRVGMNKYSIGIEIVNAGRLKKSGTAYISWFGKKYPAEEVSYAQHRNEDRATYWHQYTEEQINVVGELCELLVKEYNILYILGHEEVSPNRKIDPGPAFPLDKLRNRILHIETRDKDEDIEETEISSKGWVTASQLNIRSGPSKNQKKISNPLSRGKKVNIIKKAGDWYCVTTNIEGWVYSKYIRET